MNDALTDVELYERFCAWRASLRPGDLALASRSDLAFEAAKHFVRLGQQIERERCIQACRNAWQCCTADCYIAAIRGELKP